MQHFEILEECEELERLILEKGYHNPDVDFKINWIGNYRLTIEACLPNTYDNAFREPFDPDSFEFFGDAFDAALEYVKKLKTPEELAHEKWVQSLGRLVDQGREIGIDNLDVGDGTDLTAAFNAIVHAMEDLSSNIITDQSQTVQAAE